MNEVVEVLKKEWSKNSIRLILTPSEFARQQLFFIQEAGYFETNKGYYTKRKNLSSYLILYSISGTGILTYGNHNYTIGVGDLFFIDCKEEHSYAITSNTPWVFHWVHFNGLSSRAYYEKFISYNSCPVINFKTNQIDELIRNILEINSTKKSSNELLSSLKITEIITLLLLTCQTYCNDYKEHTYLIDGIITYINKHLHEKLTLDRIAHEFNIDKFYLHKQFKKYTNIPLNEFIINTRLTMAKEKLRFTTMPINEISEAIGISNVSHFIHLFKQREGSTPLQYRTSWKSILSP